MADVVLSAEDLGKRYFLRHRVDGYDTLREKLSAGLRLASRSRPTHRPPVRALGEFWALRHLSLQIRNGDVVGVLGRNGAGKSTLLKIVSRITEPTEGRVRIRGRVASLLEVGTGFHPELTGRENIFLNGAILGMPKSEIRAKFDQIVAFSEVARLIDTPVKRYSSGMYVRLAFAVAAHLEPDILIVDEVLSVGDAAFQRKCIDRMTEAARAGRTILFVSHNLGLVRSLCGRGVLLEEGRVVCEGTAAQAVSCYLERVEHDAATDLRVRGQRDGNGRARLTRLEIFGADDPATRPIASGQPVRFVFHVSGAVPTLSCSFTIYDAFGQAVTSFDSALHGVGVAVDAPGRACFICELDQLLLTPGRYRINAALSCDDELLDHLEGAAMLDVEQSIAGAQPIVATPGYGSAFIPHKWARSC